MYDTGIQRTNKSLKTPIESGIRTEGLGKRYGDRWAVRDLDLAVAPGSVLGLLGHNGAGKTTAIRMLTTLSTPTEGTATVAGFDIASAPAQVRARIGVAGQEATVDGLLTGRANLEMIGRLHAMSAKVARTRAEELLELFDLAAASGRLVKHYSGGMRRRLDLAASLVADPPVLFLDEPTTGLDPVSRRELWSLLERLVAGGTTLLLTTQYLDEADALADQIVVLDHGRIVATGTPAELKRRIGAERVAVTLGEATDLEPASRALVPYADGDPAADGQALTVIAAVRPETTLMELVRALDAGGVEAVDIHRREASLDDVFLTLTETRPQAEEVPA